MKKNEIFFQTPTKSKDCAVENIQVFTRSFAIRKT